MILLSDELDQEREQPLIGGLAVRTRRNAFGRQVDSFDTRLEVAGLEGGPVDVSFIRAPRVEAVLADDVEVLACHRRPPGRRAPGGAAGDRVPRRGHR
jgi:pyridoxal 5'-phosphate synthase pdxT subunit